MEKILLTNPLHSPADNLCPTSPSLTLQRSVQPGPSNSLTCSQVIHFFELFSALSQLPLPLGLSQSATSQVVLWDTDEIFALPQEHMLPVVLNLGSRL